MVGRLRVTLTGLEPEPRVLDRKVLLFSTYNMDRRHWSGVCYEGIDVISRLENTTVIDPPSRPILSVRPTVQQLLTELSGRLRSKACEVLTGVASPRIEHCEIIDDYDL